MNRSAGKLSISNAQQKDGKSTAKSVHVHSSKQQNTSHLLAQPPRQPTGARDRVPFRAGDDTGTNDALSALRSSREVVAKSVLTGQSLPELQAAARGSRFRAAQPAPSIAPYRAGAQAPRLASPDPKQIARTRPECTSQAS